MIVVASPAGFIMIQLTSACVAAVAVLELVLLAVGGDVWAVLVLVALAVEFLSTNFITIYGFVIAFVLATCCVTGVSSYHVEAQLWCLVLELVDVVLLSHSELLVVTTRPVFDQPDAEVIPAVLAGQLEQLALL